MARGRMISKTLGSSRRFSALAEIAGDKTEFCQALYPLIVAHADDFGRLEGDSFTISKRVFPVSRRSEAEFEEALGYLQDAKLISWYGTADEKTVEVSNFSEHQQGLHKRTKSKFPDPPGTAHDTPSWSESSTELFFMIPEDKVGMFKSGRRTPAMMVHLAPRLSRDLAQAENTKEGL